MIVAAYKKEKSFLSLLRDPVHSLPAVGLLHIQSFHDECKTGRVPRITPASAALNQSKHRGVAVQKCRVLEPWQLALSFPSDRLSPVRLRLLTSNKHHSGHSRRQGPARASALPSSIYNTPGLPDRQGQHRARGQGANGWIHSQTFSMGTSISEMLGILKHK